MNVIPSSNPCRRREPCSLPPCSHPIAAYMPTFVLPPRPAEYNRHLWVLRLSPPKSMYDKIVEADPVCPPVQSRPLTCDQRSPSVSSAARLLGGTPHRFAPEPQANTLYQSSSQLRRPWCQHPPRWHLVSVRATRNESKGSLQCIQETARMAHPRPPRHRISPPPQVRRSRPPRASQDARSFRSCLVRRVPR